MELDVALAQMQSSSPKFGTSQLGDPDGGNYTEIQSDGTMRRVGTSTAWRDIVGDLFGKKILSTSGKVDYDFDENAIDFKSGGSITTANDRVGGNLEINHEHKVGTSITFKPHIHWFQTVTTGVAEAFTLTMRYRLQKNNATKTTSWTTVTCGTGLGGDDIFDFTGEVDGVYNQISTFPDMTLNCEISDTIQFQMARTDSSGGNMYVYFMDIHGEIDSDGSDTEYAKS